MFRDGRSVTRLEGSGLSRAALIEAIVGRPVERLDKPPVAAQRSEVVVSVAGLSRRPKVRGVSFDIRRGEVLGLGGLVGAGRSELARLLFGADRIDAGAMTLEGRPYAPSSPAAAVRAGFGFVPEERRADGLVLAKSVAFNLQLANLARIVHSRALPFIDSRRRATLTLAMIRDLAIKTAGIEIPVGPPQRRQPAEGRHRPLAACEARRS